MDSANSAWSWLFQAAGLGYGRVIEQGWIVCTTKKLRGMSQPASCVMRQQVCEGMLNREFKELGKSGNRKVGKIDAEKCRTLV